MYTDINTAQQKLIVADIVKNNSSDKIIDEHHKTELSQKNKNILEKDAIFTTWNSKIRKLNSRALVLLVGLMISLLIVILVVALSAGGHHFHTFSALQHLAKLIHISQWLLSCLSLGSICVVIGIIVYGLKHVYLAEKLKKAKAEFEKAQKDQLKYIQELRFISNKIAKMHSKLKELIKWDFKNAQDPAISQLVELSETKIDVTLEQSIMIDEDPKGWTTSSVTQETKTFFLNGKEQVTLKLGEEFYHDRYNNSSLNIGVCIDGARLRIWQYSDTQG